MLKHLSLFTEDACFEYELVFNNPIVRIFVFGCIFQTAYFRFFFV